MRRRVAVISNQGRLLLHLRKRWLTYIGHCRNQKSRMTWKCLLFLLSNGSQHPEFFTLSLLTLRRQASAVGAACANAAFGRFQRLRASRGRRCRGQQRTSKTTVRSERSSALKKGLTEPTLLEMSGTNCHPCAGSLTKLGLIRQPSVTSYSSICSQAGGVLRPFCSQKFSTRNWKIHMSKIETVCPYCKKKMLSRRVNAISQSEYIGFL